MKALYFSEINSVKLMDVEEPRIQNSTDVIIKVTLTAICGSDIHLKYGHIKTTPGYVMGHEYVGVVVQAGSDVHNFKTGDRVVGAGTPFCGVCENCKNGHISRCINGGIFGSGKEYGGLDGSHAEYMRIPYADKTLIHIPEELSDEQVLFVGDILATGYNALVKTGINSSSTVLIFGAGPVGLCAVEAARIFNPKKIILVGKNNFYRVEMGLKLGATEGLLADNIDVVSEIMRLTDGRGADVVVEAVGSPHSMQNAIYSASIGATISIVGVPGNEDVPIPMFNALLKNLTIEIGLVDLSCMETLLGLIKDGVIDTTSLITHRMNLDSIEKAFEIFENRQDHVMKIAIKP